MLEPGNSEQIAPGVSSEWSADRQRLLFRIADYKHATLDAWANAMLSVVSSPDGPPYLIYYFLEIPSPFAVPYLERKFQELINAATAPAAGRAYIAVVIPSPFISVARIIMLIQEAIVHRKFAVTAEVFPTLDEALSWIDSKRQ